MAAARPPCELGWLLTRPVLQAAFGAVAGVALAAPQNCSGRQLQLLLQAAARGAVQGVASSPVEEAGPLAEELEARLSAVRPVLAECISAAHGAREPHIPCTQRVRRNLAEHFGFGQGAAGTTTWCEKGRPAWPGGPACALWRGRRHRAGAGGRWTGRGTPGGYEFSWSPWPGAVSASCGGSTSSGRKVHRS